MHMASTGDATPKMKAVDSVDAEDEPDVKRRRRVTRACDECRRKKIKCDGRTPCTHCCIYEYTCTYLQPSNRRRNPPMAYVEDLEQKCARYEELLKHFVPDFQVDGNQPDLLQHSEPSARASMSSASSTKTKTNPRGLESMLGKVLSLNRDNDGEIDFRGDSSGTFFVKSVFDQVLADDNIPDVYGSEPQKKAPQRDLAAEMVHDIEQARNSPASFEEEEITLPSLEVAQQLTTMCLDNACVLIQLVFLPDFVERLNGVYSGTEDENFLPVIYSSMAVGCLFAKDIAEKLGILDLKVRAFQYFQASKRLCDPLTRANMEILQTLMFQVFFLHSTANSSTCWTYIGTALRCAERMGIHRKFDSIFTPQERQLRQKMFWSIRAMDIYHHAVLGLPKGIADSDHDQSFPLEVDDQYIVSSGVSNQPPGVPSLTTALIHFIPLMTLLSKVVAKVYPIHRFEENGPEILHSDLEELQSDLELWSRNLPPHLILTPTSHTKDKKFYVQALILAYAYNHVILILYRPFLHYITLDRTHPNQDLKVFAERAKSGAFRILELTREMLLNHRDMFGHIISTYSTFFSGMIMIYCIIREFPYQSDRKECLEGVGIAVEAMEYCSHCSFAAEQCMKVFQAIMAKIPHHEGTYTQHAVPSGFWDAGWGMGTTPGANFQYSDTYQPGGEYFDLVDPGLMSWANKNGYALDYSYP